MTPVDRLLLNEIKRKVTQDAGLNDSTVWSQKDFDFLSYFIEERTGCRLSVSTIKRVWSNDFRRLPHISTLNALSTTAFNKNWQRLKSAYLSDSVEKETSLLKNTFGHQKSNFKKVALAFLMLIPVVLTLIVSAKALQKKQNEKRPITDVTFGYHKALDNKLPNTVVFNYDIEEIHANQFFLQQSWDTSRKVEIFKGTKERTDIYYIPGYFTAKLIADDAIIKEMPIHVVYEDWFIAARQPMSKIVTFDENLWLAKDYLGIAKENLGLKGVDMHKEFQLAFYHVKNFEVDGDNLTYSASFKMNHLESVDCPIMNIHLQGTNGYYWVMIGNSGCGSELAVRIGDTLHSGKSQDLTKLTANMYQWNAFEIEATGKNVRLKLNGAEVLATSYQTSIGNIMEISYFFNGLGMIDDVKLTNGQGRITFHDDFENQNKNVP